MGELRLRTAARGPIAAALADDPGETVPLPADLSGARAAALEAAGFGFTEVLAGPAATAAVIVDVAGLYDDEVFSDPALADAAAPLRTLAATGVRFENTWARSRDAAVNEYQLLTGGYPIARPWISMADDDPTQTVLPAAGLLAMPPPSNRVADQAAYHLWRGDQPFADPSLFDAAVLARFATALVGQPDLHIRHFQMGAEAFTATDAAGAAAAVSAELAQNPRSLIFVALGGARTADRHSSHARDELAALAGAVADVAQAASGALVVVTSRAATSIDDAGSDFYGAGTSRHVPLVVLGPNVRAGVVSGQPATPADVPATVLYGLGLPPVTDFADGTRPVGVGATSSSALQLAPPAAFEGHVLLRAFTARGLRPSPTPLP